MKAFPPCTLSEDSRPFLRQALSKVLRTEFQGVKGNFWRWIEIEDHAVRNRSRSIEAPQG